MSPYFYIALFIFIMMFTIHVIFEFCKTYFVFGMVLTELGVMCLILCFNDDLITRYWDLWMVSDYKLYFLTRGFYPYYKRNSIEFLVEFPVLKIF